MGKPKKTKNIRDIHPKKQPSRNWPVQGKVIFEEHPFTKCGLNTSRWGNPYFKCILEDASGKIEVLARGKGLAAAYVKHFQENKDVIIDYADLKESDAEYSYITNHKFYIDITKKTEWRLPMPKKAEQESLKGGRKKKAGTCTSTCEVKEAEQESLKGGRKKKAGTCTSTCEGKESDVNQNAISKESEVATGEKEADQECLKGGRKKKAGTCTSTCEGKESDVNQNAISNESEVATGEKESDVNQNAIGNKSEVATGEKDEKSQYADLNDQQKKDMISEVVRRNHTGFIADMQDPQLLLDAFTTKKLFSTIVLRDIREQATTSQKNREILKRVKALDWHSYCIFKGVLKENKDDMLLRKFEDTEKDYYNRISNEDSPSLLKDDKSKKRKSEEGEEGTGKKQRSPPGEVKTHGQTANFGKDVDDTIQHKNIAENYWLLKKVGGLYIGDQLHGTVFRVGSCFAMTCLHLIDKLVDPIKGDRILETVDVHLVFGDGPVTGNKYKVRREVTCLRELDVLILEILVSENAPPLPPPFRLALNDLTPGTSSLILAGFGHLDNDKNLEHCEVVTSSEDKLAKAREWIEANFDYCANDEYNMNLNLHIAVNAFQKHGASGGPLIEKHSQGAIVTAVYEKGVPTSFYNGAWTPKMKSLFPKAFVCEVGVKMKAVFECLSQQPHLQPLVQDLFSPLHKFSDCAPKPDDP